MFQKYGLNQQKPAPYYSFHALPHTCLCTHTNTFLLCSVAGRYLKCANTHLPIQILVRISVRIFLPIILPGSLLMCICLIWEYYLYRSSLHSGFQTESWEMRSSSLHHCWISFGINTLLQAEGSCLLHGMNLFVLYALFCYPVDYAFKTFLPIWHYLLIIHQCALL